MKKGIFDLSGKVSLITGGNGGIGPKFLHMKLMFQMKKKLLILLNWFLMTSVG